MYKVIKNGGDYEIEDKGVIYKKGDKLNSFTNYVDDNGRNYKKNVDGIIEQITKNLVSLKINGYIESFQIPELFHFENNIELNTIQLDIDSYAQSTISDCIEDLNKKGKGFVFTKQQLKEVYEQLDAGDINCKYEDGIYMLNTAKGM